LAELAAAVSDKIPSLLSIREMTLLKTITDGHIVYTQYPGRKDMLLLAKHIHADPKSVLEFFVIPEAFVGDPWSVLFLVVRGAGIRTIMWGLDGITRLGRIDNPKYML
jgi:hypothetical protein